MGAAASTTEAAAPLVRVARTQRATWASFESSTQHDWSADTICAVCTEPFTEQSTRVLLKPCEHVVCAACSIRSLVADNTGPCPSRSCVVQVVAWDVLTAPARSARATRAATPVVAAPTTAARCFALKPPESTTALPELSKLLEYRAKDPDVSDGSMWVGFQEGSGAEEGRFQEHVFGLDVGADRIFSANMGQVVYRICTKPEGSRPRKDDAKELLSLGDIMAAAAKEPSSFYAFLWAAATNNTELPEAPTTPERRSLLGAYTAYHIILNVAHREHTADLQDFVARVVETSGASDNARQLLTQMCLSTGRRAEWKGLAGATEANETGRLKVHPDPHLTLHVNTHACLRP